MSIDPYQTPETIPVHERGGPGGLGRFGATMSTSSIAWVSVVLLVLNITVMVIGFLRNHFIIIEVAPSQSLAIVLYIATVLSVCMWTSKSMINAWAEGEIRPTITPGWAAVWYFIPIAFFWKPYQAIKEIWENLYGSDASKALPQIWWLFWLLNMLAHILSIIISITLDIFEEYELYSSVLLVWKVLRILSAVFLIFVILRITRGHQERINQKY